MQGPLIIASSVQPVQHRHSSVFYRLLDPRCRDQSI
jgi:hypothetical protein